MRKSIYTAVDIGIIVVFAILLVFAIVTLLTLSKKTTDFISFVYKVQTRDLWFAILSL
jgi:hypothetical protein